MSKKIQPSEFQPFAPTKTKQNSITDTTTERPDDIGLDMPAMATTVMLEMPIVSELPPGVLGTQHVELQLTRTEAQTARRLFDGAQTGPNPARLKNGRFVQSTADVFRLFLERAGR